MLQRFKTSKTVLELLCSLPLPSTWHQPLWPAPLLSSSWPALLRDQLFFVFVTSCVTVWLLLLCCHSDTFTTPALKQSVSYNSPGRSQYRVQSRVLRKRSYNSRGIAEFDHMCHPQSITFILGSRYAGNRVLAAPHVAQTLVQPL